MNDNNNLNQDHLQINNEVKRNKIVSVYTMKFMGNKKFLIMGVVAIFMIIIGIFIMNNDKTINNDRVKSLLNIPENKMLHFKIDDKNFIIGDKLKNIKKDYNYVESFDKINPDSVIISSFSKNNKSDFLGAIYCSSTTACDYEEAILIKANFYKDSKVLIDDKINFDSYYDDFVKLYGNPVGKYYQDKTMYVWSLGKKVGDPYILAGFDTGGLFSSNTADKISIGIWWYEGEYEKTVVKVDNHEKENIN